MKKYTIKKGEHYSTHLFKPYLGFKKEFNLTIQFTDSCRYNLGDIDQLDINKLFGVSFGDHQKNSIRIGWNYNLFTDKIDVFSYVYEGGVRKYEKIEEVFINEIFTLKLDLNFTNNAFSIISDTTIYFREFGYPKMKLGYYLYPYFGGNKPAPQDIIINMEVL
jgi:hypothetical protein